MPVTPTYNFPYPALSDPPNGPSQVQGLATGVETELVRIDNAALSVGNRVTTLENSTGDGEWTLGAQSFPAGGADNKITAAATQVGAPTFCTYAAGVLTLNKTGLWTISFAIEITNALTSHWVWLGNNATSATRYTGSAQNGGFYSGSITRRFTSGSQLALWEWGTDISDLVTANCRLQTAFVR